MFYCCVGVTIAKISAFIIGLVIFMMFTAIIVIFMSKLAINYPNSNVTTSDIQVYDKLSEMRNLSKEIESKSNIDQKSNILDIAGYYLNGAYNTLKVSKESINTFSTMSDNAIDNSNLGETKSIFKIAISIIILINIVIGIIISALVYKEL